MTDPVHHTLRIASSALAFFALTLLLCWGLRAQTGNGARIPLCPGLTIVTAVNEPDGDYESIKTVQSVTDSAITLRYSSEQKEGSVVRRTKVRRTVLVKDLQSAALYANYFAVRGALTIPGTTAIGTSRAVLHALETAGDANLGIFDASAGTSPADPSVHPNIYDYQMVDRIRRVGAGPVSVPVLVNDASVSLPAIQARGDYVGDKAEFFFLADDANPIALRYRIGRAALDVVKISFPCAGTRGRASASVESRLEQSLLATGHADVYSIYFSFNSDVIRDESDSTLKEIGDVLSRHPDWRLAIAGHTDSIGGDSYNLELSRRRAAAVKDAVVRRSGVDAARLTSTGYGERSPIDRNDTLEGRARNRRVELARIQ